MSFSFEPFKEADRELNVCISAETETDGVPFVAQLRSGRNNHRMTKIAEDVTHPDCVHGTLNIDTNKKITMFRKALALPQHSLLCSQKNKSL
jgi:hypothetical protein